MSGVSYALTMLAGTGMADDPEREPTLESGGVGETQAVDGKSGVAVANNPYSQKAGRHA